MVPETEGGFDPPDCPDDAGFAVDAEPALELPVGREAEEAADRLFEAEVGFEAPG